MNAMRDLYDRIALFGAGRLSKKQLEDWFFESLWDAEDSSDDPAQALVFRRLEGILAEASHSHWSDDCLAAELVNTVRPFVPLLSEAVRVERRPVDRTVLFFNEGFPIERAVEPTSPRRAGIQQDWSLSLGVLPSKAA